MLSLLLVHFPDCQHGWIGPVLFHVVLGSFLPPTPAGRWRHGDTEPYFLLSHIGELSHGVSEERANGIATSDWLGPGS